MKLLQTLLVAAIALVLGTPAFSQDSGPEGASTTAAVREEATQLTPREMVDRADEYVGEMREVLKDVLRVLEDAREEKDVVKLNCVNEKLTQVKGLLRVSEQASISLQEGVAKQDDDDARHEYTKIAIAREKVSQLRAEAEECIGQLAFVIDEDTVVDVEVPEDLPDMPTEVGPVPPVIVRPPAASPVD